MEEPTVLANHLQELRAEVAVAQVATGEAMTNSADAWVADGVVPERLHKLLVDGLDVIASGPNKDFTPETKQCIQALIDPSLFPYVDNISYVRDISHVRDIIYKSDISDAWGLPPLGEVPQYRWLPAQFYVDRDGSVTAKTYINNVDLSQRNLYTAIEFMFSLFLPMFEHVLNKPLRERELQVIVHAFDYIVHPGASMLQNKWYKEGIPSEYIVASGLYYYSSSPCLVNGKLGLCYNPPRFVSLKYTMRKIPTPEGRLLAFSNSLHRTEGIENQSNDEEGKCRIFGFFLVDPEKEIISTKHVPEQQWEFKKLRIMDALDEVVKAKIGKAMPEEMLLEIVEWVKIGFTLEEARMYRIGLIRRRTMNQHKRRFKVWEGDDDA